ncbi:hypothetical protein ACHAXN_005295 [Cyclotella atomus]
MKHIILLLASAAFTHPSLAFAPPKQARTKPALTSASQQANDDDDSLKVAIIGAGPSGLLLAHRLLLSSFPVASLEIYESRSDPRLASNLDGRAYALGLGIRGRTAIKSVDEQLWEAIKSRGFECDRFRLHINERINVKLRDAEVGVEPSVLIYQTDLCGALLDELDNRSKDSSIDVRVQFNANVTDVDLISSQIKIGDHIHDSYYDLIVGSDGANSVVRRSLTKYSAPFAATQRKLPGYFKVARVAEMPPKMDPRSVALVLPRKGTVTAFVEPTIGGGGCVLFACRLVKNSSADANEIDLEAALFGDASVTTNQVEDMINEAYPLLEGTSGLSEAVQTLLSQRNGVADSVKCNIYHSKPDVTPTAIIGDAAHATGGVSGQGCNSALMDAKVLSDCFAEYCSMQGSKKAKLHECLKSYSAQQVPEGLALYDLSFGNDGETLPIYRSIASVLSTVIDSLFRGRWGIGKKPLQTLLASSSTSFVEIRREREKYFVKDFPSDEELVGMLDGVYK